jgi:hypothetical protein
VADPTFPKAARAPRLSAPNDVLRLRNRPFRLLFGVDGFRHPGTTPDVTDGRPLHLTEERPSISPMNGQARIEAALAVDPARSDRHRGRRRG